MSSQTTGAVLDTSFLIDYRDGEPETKQFLTEYKGERGEDVAVPTLVLYELYKGLFRGDGIPDVLRLDEELRWADRVGFDRNAALEAGMIEAELTSQGELINPVDILIAGIARRNGVLLVTADGHYSNIQDLLVFNVREDSLNDL